MTDIKETNLQDLEYVTGGAVKEFGQLAGILVASPYSKQSSKLAGGNLSSEELAFIMKDKLANVYAIDADFYLNSSRCINVFRDQMTGQTLSYNDVLERIII